MGHVRCQAQDGAPKYDRPPRGRRPASSGDDLSVSRATLSPTPAAYELQRGNALLQIPVTGFTPNAKRNPNQSAWA